MITSRKITLIVLSLLSSFAFADPSVPENTLSKNCLEYFKTQYEPVDISGGKAKVFVYARDNEGNDLCYMHHGDRKLKVLIEEAVKKCQETHKSSECKVASINDNWMVAEDDFTQITQPDESVLTAAEVQALMDKAKVMLRGSCTAFYKKYLLKTGNKVFAYALDGEGRAFCAQNSDFIDMAYASKKVVEYCENRKKATTGNCVLFSVNNELVAKPEDFKEALAMINSQSGDIFELAKTGTPDELQQALDSGIDVNIQDKFGYTPLLRAIKVNRFDNVRFLIEKGADISIKENLGSDALNMAVYSRYNNINLVKFLLEKGADVNTKTKRPGDTPLHNAAELGRLDVLQLLLDRGVDVNQQNNYTETALHKAADQGHVNVLRYLLDNGANINTQTRRGITPLDNAIFRDMKDAIEFLRSKGGIENNPQHK